MGYSANAGEIVCKFNPGVTCNRNTKGALTVFPPQTCDECGWCPSVSQGRIRRWLAGPPGEGVKV